MQKAELLVDRDERVATFERIAKVHTERTNNVAEAIKAYEAVLELDPENAHAIEFLKSRYEQRRDWEKLLGILRREAQQAAASAQLEKYLSMAKLAADKIKKPEICIELWERVLERDPANSDALTQLAGFYDRTKEFGKLAFVLREQAAQTADSQARIALLVKLGTIASDKLSDDSMAIEAWKGVLALDANDRRAQEALKKRYLAMQAWDELEVFYAESAKWDELIRVLERETESPQATPETKIRLYFKIAQLWAERKEKTDRAAKYYEKVLELDAQNRDAALRADPDLRGGQRREEARRRVRDQAGRRRGRLREARDAARARRTVRRQAQGPRARRSSGSVMRCAAAPEDVRSIEDLERAAKLTQRWGEAADVLANAVAGALSSEAQVTLRLRLSGAAFRRVEADRRRDRALSRSA